MTEHKRQFILPTHDSMNVSEGKVSGTSTPNSHISTKKRLQFLKNNELNPVKIKLNELMSYKRLGTTGHLAYCSSLRTVQSFKNFESYLSIESKQMPS